MILFSKSTWKYANSLRNTLFVARFSINLGFKDNWSCLIWLIFFLNLARVKTFIHDLWCPLIHDLETPPMSFALVFNEHVWFYAKAPTFAQLVSFSSTRRRFSETRDCSLSPCLEGRRCSKLSFWVTRVSGKLRSWTSLSTRSFPTSTRLRLVQIFWRKRSWLAIG